MTFWNNKGQFPDRRYDHGKDKKGWDSRKTDLHLWYLAIIAILLWIIFNS